MLQNDTFFSRFFPLPLARRRAIGQCQANLLQLSQQEGKSRLWLWVTSALPTLFVCLNTQISGGGALNEMQPVSQEGLTVPWSRLAHAAPAQPSKVFSTLQVIISPLGERRSRG